MSTVLKILAALGVVACICGIVAVMAVLVEITTLLFSNNNTTK